ncbi:hypothetical protein MKW92_052792 [Papaver armeniacum]|nr:hypothetical protein MKW92_052792 [Papaver armeniacum]
MLTVEILFGKFFERKNSVIEQLNQQKDLYDQYLASTSLINGIRPPSWLLKDGFEAGSSQLKELKNEDLISGLLFPPSRANYPSSIGNKTFYSRSIFAANTVKQLSGDFFSETCASNKSYSVGERSADIPNCPLDGKSIELETTLNTVPELDNTIFSPQNQTDLTNHFDVTTVGERSTVDPKCNLNGSSLKSECTFNTITQQGGTTGAPQCQTDLKVFESSFELPQSLVRIQRSRSRQRALELRNSASGKSRKRAIQESNAAAGRPQSDDMKISEPKQLLFGDAEHSEHVETVQSTITSFNGWENSWPQCKRRKIEGQSDKGFTTCPRIWSAKHNHNEDIVGLYLNSAKAGSGTDLEFQQFPVSGVVESSIIESTVGEMSNGAKHLVSNRAEASPKQHLFGSAEDSEHVETVQSAITSFNGWENSWPQCKRRKIEGQSDKGFTTFPRIWSAKRNHYKDIVGLNLNSAEAGPGTDPEFQQFPVSGVVESSIIESAVGEMSNGAKHLVSNSAEASPKQLLFGSAEDSEHVETVQSAITSFNGWENSWPQCKRRKIEGQSDKGFTTCPRIWSAKRNHYEDIVGLNLNSAEAGPGTDPEFQQFPVSGVVESSIIESAVGEMSNGAKHLVSNSAEASPKQLLFGDAEDSEHVETVQSAITSFNGWENSWPQCKRRKIEGQSDKGFTTCPRIWSAKRNHHEDIVGLNLNSAEAGSGTDPEFQQFPVSGVVELSIIESAVGEMSNGAKHLVMEGVQCSPQIHADEAEVDGGFVLGDANIPLGFKPMLLESSLGSSGIKVEDTGIHLNEVEEQYPFSIAMSVDRQCLPQHKQKFFCFESEKTPQSMGEVCSTEQDIKSNLEEQLLSNYDNLDLVGADQSMPEFEKFTDLPDTIIEGMSILEELCPSSSMGTPYSLPSKSKFQMDLSTWSGYNPLEPGRPYSDFMPSSSDQSECDAWSPYTPQVGKTTHSILSSSGGQHSKKQRSTSSELTPIHEDSSSGGEENRNLCKVIYQLQEKSSAIEMRSSTFREPLVDISNIHPLDFVYDNEKIFGRGSLADSFKEEANPHGSEIGSSKKPKDDYGTERKYKNKDKENRSSSLCSYGTEMKYMNKDRESRSSYMFGRKATEKKHNHTIVDKGQVGSNIATGVKSFTELLPVKRKEAKVKAIDRAKEAKNKEEEKKKHREMMKEKWERERQRQKEENARKQELIQKQKEEKERERERLKEEKSRELELIQKRKEVEAKRKEAEMQARKRLREDEKKEKDQKRCARSHRINYMPRKNRNAELLMKKH